MIGRSFLVIKMLLYTSLLLVNVCFNNVSLLESHAVLLSA